MRHFRPRWLLLAVLPALVSIVATSAKAAEPSRETTVEIDGKPILPMHGTTAGFWLYANDEGAQLALMGHPPRRAVATLDQGRRITIRVPTGPVVGRVAATLRATHFSGSVADVSLRLGGINARR